MHAYSSNVNPGPVLGVISLGAVAVAIGTNALTESMGWTADWFWSAPSVAAAFGLLYLLVDQWVWRWKLVQKLGVVVPDVGGTYTGRLLAPPWREGADPTNRVISLRVKQTWTRISVQFEIEPVSSVSRSLTAELVRVGDDSQLTYTYVNEVQPGVADDDMRDHDGTAKLVIHRDGSARGRYYNYRGRQGTLEVQRA